MGVCSWRGSKFFSTRPFDSDRLSGLLEGLEASILTLSMAMKGNRDLRIDSPYFSQAAIAVDEMVSQKTPHEIKDVSSDVRSFGAYALTNEFDYQDEGIPYLRGTNFAGDFVDFAEVLRISPEAHKLLYKSEVVPGMVLLSMSGSVGSVTVALDSWNYPINSNQDIAKITPSSIDPFYLAAFLSCTFGRTQINRLPVGSVQQHVFFLMIERIKVPRFSFSFESAVARIMQKAYESHELVSQYFIEAENTLLGALGLANWTPPEPLSYTARSNDVIAAGRMDAQFFSSKYDEFLNDLPASGVEVRSIRDIRAYNARGLQPEYVAGGDVFVVNSRHILEARVDYDNLERTTTKWLNINERARLKSGDILTYTTGAKIGRTAHFDLESPAVASNHVNILRLREGNPVYVAFVMNSLVGRLQTERHMSGTAQPELYPGDIDKFKIPFIPDEIQSLISNSLRRSEESKSQARYFVEVARNAVEIAIKGEESNAMESLHQVKGID